MHTHTHVYSIQFTTNQGEQSLVYGKINKLCYDVYLPGGLLGLEGYADTYVNGLNFVSNQEITTYKSCI